MAEDVAELETELLTSELVAEDETELLTSELVAEDETELLIADDVAELETELLTSELVAEDVIYTRRKGLVSRGRFAPTINIIGQWPATLLDVSPFVSLTAFISFYVICRIV